MRKLKTIFLALGLASVVLVSCNNNKSQENNAGPYDHSPEADSSATAPNTSPDTIHHQ